MHDAVGEVLAQRKALDRGAGAGVALSLLLHGAVSAAAVFAALRHTPEQNVPMIEIKFAKMPAPPAPVHTPAPPQPKAQPAPAPAPIAKSVAKPVAASPYGKSPKKATAAPPPPQPATGNSQLATAPEIPVGGTGAVGAPDADPVGYAHLSPRNYFAAGQPPTPPLNKVPPMTTEAIASNSRPLANWP